MSLPVSTGSFVRSGRRQVYLGHWSHLSTPSGSGAELTCSPGDTHRSLFTKTKERIRGRRSWQRCPRGAHGHTGAQSSSQQESAELLKEAFEGERLFCSTATLRLQGKFPLPGREKSLSPWVFPLSLPPARGELAAKLDAKVPIGEQSLHSKTLEELLSGCQHSLNLGVSLWPVHLKTIDTSWAPPQCSVPPG